MLTQAAHDCQIAASLLRRLSSACSVVASGLQGAVLQRHWHACSPERSPWGQAASAEHAAVWAACCLVTLCFACCTDKICSSGLLLIV